MREKKGKELEKNIRILPKYRRKKKNYKTKNYEVAVVASCVIGSASNFWVLCQKLIYLLRFNEGKIENKLHSSTQSIVLKSNLLTWVDYGFKFNKEKLYAQSIIIA